MIFFAERIDVHQIAVLQAFFDFPPTDGKLENLVRIRGAQFFRRRARYDPSLMQERDPGA